MRELRGGKCEQGRQLGLRCAGGKLRDDVLLDECLALEWSNTQPRK